LKTVWVGLGANLGDRAAGLAAGLARLAAGGVKVTAVSSLYRTEPVGGPPQPDYLNAAAGLLTRLKPRELLALIRSAEAAAGRRPAERNAPRPLDIDILLFGRDVIAESDLIVPHPGVRAGAAGGNRSRRAASRARSDRHAAAGRMRRPACRGMVLQMARPSSIIRPVAKP